MNKDINLDLLGNVFEHTTTSYKFYWALSLLDIVQDKRSICAIHEVTIGMLARAWNTEREGKFLGKQDKLQERIENIKEILNIDNFESIDDKEMFN